jgi:hypothetical protein
MSEQIDQFLSEIDGALSPEQASQVLALAEGNLSDSETTGEPEPEVKAVAPEEIPAPKPENNTALVDTALADSLKSLAEAVDGLKPKEPQPEPPKPEEPPKPLRIEDFMGDFSAEDIAKGTAEFLALKEAEIEKRLTEKLLETTAPLQAKAEEDAKSAHFASIFAKHPDAETIVADPAFKAWFDAQPTFSRNAISVTLQQGNAESIIEVFDVYKQTTQKPASSAAHDLKKKTDAIIAAAAAVPPNSLTDIPGGRAAGSDPFEVIDNLPPEQQIESVMKLSPEMLERWLNRSA